MAERLGRVGSRDLFLLRMERREVGIHICAMSYRLRNTPSRLLSSAARL